MHVSLNTDSLPKVLHMLVIHYPDRLRPHELPFLELQDDKTAVPVGVAGFQVRKKLWLIG